MKIIMEYKNVLKLLTAMVYKTRATPIGMIKVKEEQFWPLPSTF